MDKEIEKDVLPLAQSAEQMPVRVHIQTTYWSEDEKQVIELTVFGQLYKKRTAYFLQYEEVHEEGKMKTIIKLTENEAVIMRSGLLKMRMRLRETERLRGTYETPYGNLPIYTKAKQIKHVFDEQHTQGTITLHYDLMIDGSQTGTYHLQVTYEEAHDEHR